MNYLQNENFQGKRVSRALDQTSIEISGQPELWLDSFKKVVSEKSSIKSFLRKVLKLKDLHIILTGAGTSAFIGESLSGTFQKSSGCTTSAIPTTHLVTHPALYLQKEKPILLISFARSGNSPESSAAVKIASAFCQNIYHLIITCNPKGDLIKSVEGDNKYIFVLPPSSNDQALAMTGSYTSMLLAGILIARLDELDELESQVQVLSEYGRRILRDFSEGLREVASMDFKRAIFLGSGPLYGTARESHLKLQELTDGKVICKFDSFLGIRHGPKAVIDEDTLVVYLLSNSPYVRRYEIDLIAEVEREGRALYSIGMCEIPDPSYKVDHLIAISDGQTCIDEELFSVCAVLPSQILGYYKSVQLGLNPDQPSVSGAISRVVSGVGIYAYHES